VTALVPSRIRVRMYQVGFGDCFLLSFEYSEQLRERDRHMLIDFGSTHLASGIDLDDVADSIVEVTRGQLDVLVISHRHNDHISGFGKQSTFKKMKDLNPRLIVRPWTEDPELREDASAPDEQQKFIRSLDTARCVVTKIRSAIGPAALEDPLLACLYDEADVSQEPAPEAITNIDSWVNREGAQSIYAHFGMDIGLDQYIPGVTCDVLGPPRVDLWPEVARQRDDDPDEFWLSELAAVESVGLLSDAEPARWQSVAAPRGIGPARGLLDYLRDHHRLTLLDLVRRTDHALNNTSLILLITVGDSRRMLFPGDAQIENWKYLLRDKAGEPFRALLSQVDLYKVGHHGSRNATPKSLFGIWNEEGGLRKPMVALMSTKPDVHGKDGPHPVPSDKLVDALKDRMTLLRTDNLLSGERYVEVIAAVANSREPFELVTE
jgi:hypothetical protein